MLTQLATRERGPMRVRWDRIALLITCAAFWLAMVFLAVLVASLPQPARAEVSCLAAPPISSFAQNTSTVAELTLAEQSCTVNKAYTTAAAMTVDAAAITAGRGLMAACSVAGNIVVTMAGGGNVTVPVNTGLTILPFAVTRVLSAGQTATCTFSKLD